MLTFYLKKVWTFILQNWQIVAILILATWLRTWDLSGRAIFFGDAAHDLWSAQQAVQNRTVPLLGIASSEPRFKQGPVTVWFEMGLNLIAGYHLVPYSFFFAALSLAAVIGVYELVVTQLDKRAAWFAASWLAVSPLAVAHGRMPYHVTPLPLMTLFFLYALVRLWRRQGKWRWWWATLAWAGMFQFELAVTPLILLMPYVWWRRERSQPGSVSVRAVGVIGLQAATALAVGLWPQLYFDLTHSFAQLGGFAIWIIRRASEHQGISWSKLSDFGRSLAWYGPRFVSVDSRLVTGWWLGLLAGALCQLGQQRWQKSFPPLIELTVVATLVLMMGFFVHGSPSEAYYPPLFTFLAVLSGYAAWLLEQRWPRLIRVSWIAWMVMVTISIWQANFFVSQPQIKFSYGPGSGEQRLLVEWFVERGFDQVYLRTTEDGGKYPSYFQNLQWLGMTQGLQIMNSPQAGVPTFFIEPLESPLNSYPEVERTPFQSRQIVRVLGL